MVIWDITRPSAPTRVDVLPETGSISGISFSPDGQRVAVSNGSHTALWSLRLKEWPARRGAEVRLGAPAALAIHPSGRTAATSTAGRQVILWDITPPTEPVRVAAFETGLSGAVSSLAYSPDGNTLAVGSDRGSVELWNVASPSQARRLAAPPESTLDAITRMAFTPDGKTLVVADSHYVVFWDMRQPTLPATMGYPFWPVVPTLAFSLAEGVQAQVAPKGPGSEVVPGADGTPVGARVELWLIGPAAGSGAEPLPGPGGLGSAVEFDPGGTVLAVGGTPSAALSWAGVSSASRPKSSSIRSATTWRSRAASRSQSSALGTAPGGSAVSAARISSRVRPTRWAARIIATRHRTSAKNRRSLPTPRSQGSRPWSAYQRTADRAMPIRSATCPTESPETCHISST